MIGSGRRTPSVRRVACRRKRLRWSWSLCEGSVSDRSQGSRTNGTPISRTLSIRGETPADAGQLPWIPTPAPRHVAKTPTREASEGTPRHNICNMDTAGIEPRTRNALLMAAQPLAVRIGIMPACRALDVSRATFYRRRRSAPGHRQPRQTPARALCEAEREQVLDVLAGHASWTARRRRSWRRCSTKATTCVPSGRCIGSWPRISRSPAFATKCDQPIDLTRNIRAPPLAHMPLQGPAYAPILSRDARRTDANRRAGGAPAIGMEAREGRDRFLSVVRSMIDKIIELSRAVVNEARYGESIGGAASIRTPERRSCYLGGASQ